MSSVPLFSQMGCFYTAGTILGNIGLEKIGESPLIQRLYASNLFHLSENTLKKIQYITPVIGMMGFTLAAYYCYPLSTVPSLQNFFYAGVVSGVHSAAMFFLLEKMNALIEPLFVDVTKFSHLDEESQKNIKMSVKISNLMFLLRFKYFMNQLPGVINFKLPACIPLFGGITFISCFNRKLVVIAAATSTLGQALNILVKAALTKFAN